MKQNAESRKTKTVNKTKNRLKKIAILEGALEVFGEKGFEATTITAICKSAKIADATLYEYFESKEDVLFSIAEHYTRQHLDNMKRVSHFIHNTREKMRLIIQSYLEFYEDNPLYSSVALLNLKGSRSFLKSPAYQVVREASRSIVDAFNEGVEKRIYRDDIDGYLVRNLVLGFIEHLTIQWLLVKRPDKISLFRDTIFDMVMQSIEKKS
ncbi:TetR/AcrR family transcriptional regulator [bacterium]|nr:TetR/AcrR family transcriptional regulator [bacterium]